MSVEFYLEYKRLPFQSWDFLSHFFKEMEEEIVCNRWRDLAGDSFLLSFFLFLRNGRKKGSPAVSPERRLQTHSAGDHGPRTIGRDQDNRGP